MAAEKFTAEQVAEALTETRGMKTLAAKRLGCAYNTIVRYINKYASVREALDRAHESLGDQVELALFDEAVNKRNTAALIFLAKTKFKSRGYVERVETTGKDGGPIQLDVTALSDDELRAIVGGQG